MKRKIFVKLIALICAVSAAGLCSCGEKEVRTQPNGTVAETSAEETQTSTEQTQPTESETDETSETTEETSAETTSEESSSQAENLDSAGLAQIAYNQTANFINEMNNRGTPADDYLNFDFILDNAPDAIDPKMSPDEQIKAVIKSNANGKGKGSRIYIGNSNGTIFVQVKDSSGNITQYPTPSGNASWGEFAQ